MENFCNNACLPSNYLVCLYVCLCVRDLVHIYQFIRAIYSSINSLSSLFFFCFVYGSCTNLNGVMLISPQYKQFKAINPDRSSANKMEL